jgi:hypothetical protein
MGPLVTLLARNVLLAVLALDAARLIMSAPPALEPGGSLLAPKVHGA